jgi:uncharacterized membrane protein YfcA
MKALLEFPLGLAIGFVSGLFGITGGVIAVPVLGLLGFGQHLAQGTSLVMQLPTGFVALWQYARRNVLSARVVAAVAISSGLAAYLGTRIAGQMPASSLRRGFAIFLIVVATFTIWNALRARLAHYRAPWPFAVLIGAVGGCCSGLFGVGGAVFTIPFFALLFGLSPTAAQGMGLAVVLPAILVAVPAYTVAGSANWPAGLALGLGSICTVGFGVVLAHKLREQTLQIGLCVVMYASAAALWIHG